MKKIGEQRYNDELNLLEHLEVEEDVEGVFKHGVIDHRDNALKDVDLGPGYAQQVGSEGCKLSAD